MTTPSVSHMGPPPQDQTSTVGFVLENCDDDLKRRYEEQMRKRLEVIVRYKQQLLERKKLAPSVDATRIRTRSLSKALQQHGEGKKPEKHPHRMLTKKKLVVLQKKCWESDGFDVGDVPDHFLSHLLMIMPLWVRKKGAHGPKYFNDLSRASLKEYNEEEGSMFKFIKLIRVNAIATQGAFYYITFQAKDMGSYAMTPTSRLQNFQARVYRSLVDETDIRYCRLEKKPKLLEGSMRTRSKRLYRNPHE